MVVLKIPAWVIATVFLVSALRVLPTEGLGRQLRSSSLRFMDEKDTLEFSHRKLAKASNDSEVIPGQYIVVFKDQVTNILAKAQQLLETISSHRSNTSAVSTTLSPNILYSYSKSIKGVAIGKIGLALLSVILNDQDVDYVEQDQMVYAYGDRTNPPSWGLDRIDQATLPLNRNYHYNFTGEGVKIFVLDTGVAFWNPDLIGRTSCGGTFTSFPSNALNTFCGDFDGHGTHVSGIAAGSVYGVAPRARIVSVQVLNWQGIGSIAQVISGIEFVTGAKLSASSASPSPMVVNLSLGSRYSAAQNAAVAAAVNAGLVFVVAAGNSAVDACTFSPASTSQAITVGAIDSTDTMASYSNYGSCVDIMAPGSGIVSDWWSGGARPLSGTSMASPHVAGVAALYLERNPSWTPAQVWQAMKNDAVRGKLQGLVGNTPNLLVQTTGLS